ncbi:hypothetical protein KK449_19965 [Clostridioides difficile]|nr:hypothetical protein [Clostridioides difficile]
MNKSNGESIYVETEKKFFQNIANILQKK